jgi:polyisoprenoid-binding protein YceI
MFWMTAAALARMKTMGRHVRFLAPVLVAFVCASAYSLQNLEAAEELEVDLKTSRVYVLVDKTGLGHQHGVTGNLKSGSLTLGAKADAGQIVFDMPSFIADTDAGRKYVGLEGQKDANTQKKVTETMLSPNVLDVKKFPTATFDIDSALQTEKKSSAGNPVYLLKGQFTLHGVANPLAIEAEVVAKRQSTQVRGKFKVQQTKYGMKPYTTGLGTVGVADELTIWGDLQLKP